MRHYQSPLPALTTAPNTQVPLLQALGVMVGLLIQCKKYEDTSISAVLERFLPFLELGNVFLWLDEDCSPLGFAAWVTLSHAQHESFIQSPEKSCLLNECSQSTDRPESTQFHWLAEIVTPFSEAQAILPAIKQHFQTMSPQSEVWVLPELIKFTGLNGNGESLVPQSKASAGRLW